MKRLSIVLTFLAIFALTIPLTVVEASESSKVFKSEDRGNLIYKGNIPYFEGTKYLGWVDSIIEDRLLVSRYKTDENNNLAYCLNWDLESPDFSGNEYIKSNEEITSKEYSAIVFGFGGTQDITGEYTINNKKLTDNQRYYVTQITTYILSEDLNSQYLTLDSLVEHDGKYEEVKHSSEMLNIIKQNVSYIESNLLSVPGEETIDVTIHSEDDNEFVDKGTFYETDKISIEHSNEKGKLSIDRSELGKAYFVDTEGNIVEEVYVLAGNEFKLRIDKQDVLEDQAIKLSIIGEVSYANIHKYIPMDCEIGRGGKDLQRILWIGDELNTARDHMEFEVTEPLFDIIIMKVDENNVPLDGATFLLLDSAGEEIAEELAEDGKLIFSNLQRGQYTIIETGLPEGYTITEEGNEIDVELVDENAEITIENRRVKGTLEILKTDVVNDEPLPDTTFQIKDEAGDVIVEGKTDINGLARFSDLPYGKYTYEEIEAPVGYVIDANPYPFEIKEDGDVIKAEMDNRLIEGTLEITKTDLETGEPLQGVEFTVSNESGEIVATETTNDNGVILVEGLTYGTYSLQETKARQGYHLDNSVHAFEIINDGEEIQRTITNEKMIQAALLIKSPNNPNADAELEKEGEKERNTVGNIDENVEEKSGKNIGAGMSNQEEKYVGEKNASGPVHTKEKASSGGKLPDTATDHFNMIGIGLLLMISGLALYVSFTRKRMKQ